MASPTYCSFLLLLQFSLLLPASCSDNHWTYKLEDPSGPSHWQYDCKGQHQSPLNIPSTGLTSVIFPPLSFSHYDLQPATAILRNNGHTAKLSTEPATSEVTPLMSGGGLSHSYKFAQAHFHWGANDKKGSEHLIGDMAYPMEMHLVHYKATHSTIKEAVAEGASDSLAVLGVFFSESDQPNPGLASLLPLLDQIKTAETKAEATPFPISSLFTEDISSFYRYNGSLTTPGCNEIVQWTVVKEPVPATRDQLAAFRKLLTKESEPLVDNFRPPQLLGERQVLDVTTAQLLTKGSLSSPSPADRVRGVGVVVSMAMVLMVKMASL
eukprot:GFUD01000148.1.p1 GENE.GFUD01000148.1~~GFUD01000148.1.p1  ORF type:complete len:324 (+),score=101.21 GFUD01000148.1:119-1090(+)